MQTFLFCHDFSFFICQVTVDKWEPLLNNLGHVCRKLKWVCILLGCPCATCGRCWLDIHICDMDESWAEMWSKLKLASFSSSRIFIAGSVTYIFWGDGTEQKGSSDWHISVSVALLWCHRCNFHVLITLMGWVGRHLSIVFQVLRERTGIQN